MILSLLGVAVVAALIYQLLRCRDLKKKKEDKVSPDTADAEAAFRHQVTMLVLNGAICGLIILSLLIIVQAANAADSEKIFNAILPVFGTWVGTLLAFYFSKANFDAATKSVTDIAQKMTGVDKLQSTLAKNVMIKPDQIETLPDEYIVMKVKVGDPDNRIPLSKLVECLKNANKDRLPLFKDKEETYQKIGAAAGVIHLSTIDSFISKKASAGTSADEIKALSLGNLISDDTFKFKSVFENSFGLVDENATLGRAKAVMDNFTQKIPKEINAGCYDVFVTATGDGKEPVLGWITNDIINENAKV